MTSTPRSSRSSAVKVFPTYVQNAYLRDYEHAYVPRVQSEIRELGPAAGLELAATAADADLILVWESFEYKTPAYIKLLEEDPVLRQHGDKAYTFNYDDHPEGFLRGIYTSIEAPFFDAAVHRTWPFVWMNNPLVYNLTREEVFGVKPRLLFSFTGALSHPIRGTICETFRTPSPIYHVEEIRKWYNHGDAERQKFVQIGLDSVFCLCPRGYTSYSHRITEVMAMGRVPVIIADDWIPFSFPEPLPYYLSVAERDIPRLPDILEAQRDQAELLGRNARKLWEDYCSPKRSVISAINCMVRLQRETGAGRTMDDCRRKWRSREFLARLGWTAPRRLALRIEQHVRRRFPAAKIPGVTALMRYRNAPNLKQ